jgi:threonine dehydrogenase-like Zn-dependent dehydrogenase
MHAIAVEPSRKRLRLLTGLPRPELRTPTDVLVRIREVGVCGTDREICAFDYGTPPDGGDHLVIGHEALGEVVEVGPEVARVRPGDLVVPSVRRPCDRPSCKACRQGMQDFCYTGEFRERGINRLHGFMTGFVVDDERYMNVLPPSLAEIGMLVEPLTIAEKALLQIRDLQQRLPWACEVGPGAANGCHTAVVLGAGPVGLLGAMALRADGFRTFVYSRGAGTTRQHIVERFGATFLDAETLPPEEIHGTIGQVDVIYEAMGASQASFRAMQSLGTNGVFVFTGVPGRKGPVAIDTDSLMRNLVLKNQVVLGTVNAGQAAFENAIADLERFRQLWPEAVAGLITGRFPMQDYQQLLTGSAQGIKNVIRIEN